MNLINSEYGLVGHAPLEMQSITLLFSSLETINEDKHLLNKFGVHLAKKVDTPIDLRLPNRFSLLISCNTWLRDSFFNPFKIFLTSRINLDC